VIPAEGLRAMFRPPPWVTGGISTDDALFLVERIAAVQPQTVLEIGIGAGTSAAAILYALDQLPAAADRVLYSVDVAPRCFFNPHHATGAAAEDMYPAPVCQWRRRIPSDARRIRAELTPGTIDLIFVDGDHRHPWPLLDVLHVAPWARPEAWIALHDVSLARLMPQFQSHGAEWLFSCWPEAFLAGVGAAENIGAVRLPANLEQLIPTALELLTLKRWEGQPRADEIDLPLIFAPVAAALRHPRSWHVIK